MTAYPRVLGLGWLTPLVTLDATVDLSLHVTPREPVRTLSLTSWTFLPLLDENPSISKKLLIEMSRRLRAAERSIKH